MAAAKKKTAKKPARTKLRAEAAKLISPQKLASDASKIKQVKQQLTIPGTERAQKAAGSGVEKLNGKKPPAGYGSWRNPRKRADGSEVYSTTIHLPMELSQRIDEVRLRTRLRINEMVCEALDSWLASQSK